MYFAGYCTMKNIARILFVISAIIAGGATAIFFINMSEYSPQKNRAGLETEKIDENLSEEPVAHLFFADKKNSFLIAEQRRLSRSGEKPVRFGKSIVNALISGPRNELVRTIPKETELRALYITKGGTTYVDLTSAIRDQHPGGSKSELLAIYSIVNSLILNVSDIKSVKLLIEGNEAETLAGHIDLRFPFKANMLLTR